MAKKHDDDTEPEAHYITGDSPEAHPDIAAGSPDPEGQLAAILDAGGVNPINDPARRALPEDAEKSE